MDENSIFVLGNGPSMRGFDFTKLKDYKTVGLNAAYRYWDQIGWYPTYYCCLDVQLIRSHHKQIKRMVDEGIIKRFLLRENILDYYPNILKTGKVDILNTKRRGRYFRSSKPQVITTGGYAVRYAMQLGFKKVYLLGIDCKYVEILPEATHMTNNKKDVRLRMTKTPKHNPNYFFDGYQQAGDLYHIPNPVRNIHLEVFSILKDDIKNLNFGVEVVNCNKQSALYDNSIFEYKEFNFD